MSSIAVLRRQLAAFISDARTIRAFELLFLSTSTSRPELTQSAEPSATGFTVNLTNVFEGLAYDVWLLLRPAAGYASGTIVLPAKEGLVDQQTVAVTCTQVVTVLTVDGNGAAAVVGAPATLAANSTFKMRYSQTTDTWYPYP